jgi:hypothetical protein
LQRIALKQQAADAIAANKIEISQGDAPAEIRSSNPELAQAFESFTAATGPAKAMSAAAGAATAPAKRGLSIRGKTEAAESGGHRRNGREAAVKRKT